MRGREPILGKGTWYQGTDYPYFMRYARVLGGKLAINDEIMRSKFTDEASNLYRVLKISRTSFSGRPSIIYSRSISVL